MQLSLHADYSCRVLIYLATKNEKCSIEEIANAFDISRNHLVKIVHELGKLGFVITTRGRGGGLELSRSPELIVIGDVIRKTELSLDLVECFNPKTNNCSIIGGCGLKPWLSKALDAFLQTLDEVTLAEVVKDHQRLARSLKIANVPR